MPFSDRFFIRPGVRRLFRLAIRRRDLTRAEADDEIRLHLALRTRQLIGEGLTPDAARAEAERRFGPAEEARRTLHTSAERREDRVRMGEWMDAVRRDVRMAARGLVRAPVFTTTAVVCLALGVGANAATFSLFEELLLRPLPVPEPERLVSLGNPGPRQGRDNFNQAGPYEVLFSQPMFRDLAKAQTSLTGLAAHRLFYANFAAGRGRPQFGHGVLVSGSYFPVLGLKPALGRLLGPADDQTAGAHPVAVLSHGYWTTDLGADSGVVGKTIVINGRALTVVGVAPRGFTGTTVGALPRVFVPLLMAADVDPGLGPRASFDDRKWYWLYLFGRLSPGVSIEHARAALDAVHRAILVEVDAPLQVGMTPRGLARFKARKLTVEDGRRGQSLVHGETRTPLTLLFAITGLVVLIAAANVANLLLARAATRSTEMAVRLSLGAGRRRLVAQLLAESALLAVLGGAASLLVAGATIGAIERLVPPFDFGAGGRLALALRPPAFLFVAAVTLGTGVLFGLVPALHGTRPDLVSSLKAGSGKHSSTRSAARFRTALVTAQIALSTTLLIAAGLLIGSLRNVSRVDLGMNVEQVVQFAVAPMLNGYSPGRSRALFERIEAEIAAAPGVASVGASAVPLFSGTTRGSDMRVDGFRAGPETNVNTRLNWVGPRFFRTLGIPLLAGRDFTDGDRLDTPKVAVVNEAFAEKFGLRTGAIGRRIAFLGDTSAKGRLGIEIVGLVGDTRYSGVKEDEPPLVFLSYRQDADIGGMFFYVRTPRAHASIERLVREIMGRLDPNLPIVGLKPMSEQVRENVYLDRMIGTLSAAFAGLATLLAAVGLYGVLAYTVARRTREIGVRMALGADAWRVRRMVLGEVARMVAVGGAVGIVAALVVGRVAEWMLFGLSSSDPRVIVSAVVVLSAVAVAAGYVPAWRASRVAPMGALRAE